MWCLWCGNGNGGNGNGGDALGSGGDGLSGGVFVLYLFPIEDTRDFQ